MYVIGYLKEGHPVAVNNDLFCNAFDSLPEAKAVLESSTMEAQEEIDASTERGAVFVDWMVFAKTESGKLELKAKVAPLVSRTEVLLLTRADQPLSFNVSLLCGSLLGGQARNWKLMHRDHQSYPYKVSYAIAYTDKACKGMVHLQALKDGTLSFDVSDLVNKQKHIPFPLPSNTLYFNTDEVLDKMGNSGRVVSVLTSLKQRFGLLHATGPRGVARVSVKHPLGGPGNANAYEITLHSSQILGPDGQPWPDPVFTVIGDWEMADLCKALSQIATTLFEKQQGSMPPPD